MFCRIALLLLCVAFSLAVNDDTDCYIEGQSSKYNGNLSTTRFSKKCMDWNACRNSSEYIKDENFPDGSIIAASNYCRSPSSIVSFVNPEPWCYFAYNDRYGRDGDCIFEYCTIMSCSQVAENKKYNKKFFGIE